MGPQQRQTAKRTVLLGLLGLAFIGLVFYVAGSSHGGLPFRTTTTVKAAFRDVGSVHLNSQVRQNSVRIGQVSAIEYVNGQAVVSMALDGEPPVYADASAKVWDFSALGQKFVELSPGTPTAGPLGDKVIGAQQNEDSADLYQTLTVFEPKTLGAATSATREFGGGLVGRGPDLQDFTRSAPGLLGDLGTVSSSLSAPSADLPALLRNADRLATRFVGRQQRITSALSQTDTTLRALTVDASAPLRKTLHQLPATLDEARVAFDDLNGPLSDTRSFLHDVRPGADSLSRAEGDLRGVLREAPEPLDKVPGVADDAVPAVESLTDAFNDVQPVAPNLTRFITDLSRPVSVLGPYGRDAESLWARLRNNLDQNVSGQHYGRTTFNVTGRSLSAVSPVTVGSNPYPKPFSSDLDRFNGPAVPLVPAVPGLTVPNVPTAAKAGGQR